ncbi:MAG: protein kinase, partial [Candidatus Brocadiae bacterium]|nr:protein kinase [Candidatus Brocadiia bacterium]
ELVEGLPMSEEVRANPPSPQQMLDWMIALADALHSAHSRGIVHRDLKPQNVIITPDGKPLLIDFGVASLVSAYQPERRRDGSGTYVFMAPEQARGDADADHRVDVFGLGAMLKFLLVGKAPYEQHRDINSAIVAAIDGKVVPVPVESGPPVRRALCRIANRALDPDPARRYRNAWKMAAALRRLKARRLVLATMAVGLVLAAAGLFASSAFPGLFRGRGAPVQEVEASLEIHYQRKGQGTSYEILTADDLPLRDGDRVQIHVELSEPLYAYVILAGAKGAKLVYPPAGEEQVPVMKVQIPFPPAGDEPVHVPSDKDEWWYELEPPYGTETILLVARRERLEDAEAEAFADGLLSLGPAPAIEGARLLVVDGTGSRIHEGTSLADPGRSRALSAKPVESPKGFLAKLVKGVPKQFTVVRALAFPYEVSTQDRPE